MKAKLSQWAHRQWQKRGLIACLLYPFSLITGAIIRKRQRQPIEPLAEKYPPIIVVGNLLVGGTGKTPVVIHLCHQLQALGWRPGVISRGYGSRATEQPQGGFAPLDPDTVGDEPSLIAQQTGVAVAVHPLRLRAIEKLLQLAPDCDVIIADDGLQHYQLPRAIEIVVQDQRGVGNGWLIPAGPLREPPVRLKTVDWIIQHHPSRPAATQAALPEFKQNQGPEQIDMWLAPTCLEQLCTGTRLTVTQWQQRFKNQPVQALAGIGQPQRFFSLLEALGLPLQHRLSLADHQPLQAADLHSFSAAPIMITAKDAIKLQETTLGQDKRFWVVHVHAQFTPNGWSARVAQQLRQNTHNLNTFPYTKHQKT